MSHKGCCYDNSVVESFFSSLKREILIDTSQHSAQQTIVFSKMNDKFPLWYYQPKVVSLYIYALKV